MTEQQKDKALPRILQTDELPNKDYYPSMWAEVPKPIDDELLSSWMVRVAMSNLTTLPSIIYETLKIHPFNLDVDVTWNVELMDLFEKKTGETREILQKMGFHEIKKDIDKTIDEQNSLQMFSQIW
nr:hypothetical protein [Candidatus Sigynarchaeota archaeon]